MLNESEFAEFLQIKREAIDLTKPFDQKKMPRYSELNIKISQDQFERACDIVDAEMKAR